MKKTTYIILAFVGLLVIFYIYNFYFIKQKSEIIINNTSFKIELADSPEEQNLGLGNRDSLPEDHGMLFIFDKPGNHSFWMKGMKFPLDMIFILDNKIVGIYENVPILTDNNLNPRIYGSEIESDMVLEINAGLSKKYNFKKGDIVKIQIKD